MVPPPSAPPDSLDAPDDETAALLRRDAPGEDEDLDAQLQLAELRRRFAGAEIEPVRFRHWEVERRLGRGGMGAVYLARDPKLDRRVALKILAPPPGADRSTMDQRLRREAQALARVTHPNVLQVYGVHPEGDRTIIEMEYIEGSTLRQWQSQPRPWRETVAAYASAGDGLAAIHAAGLVHRDVKPENLLMDAKGHVKVADLGLAVDPRTASAPTSAMAEPSLLTVPLTRASTIVGTPGYMAPEQFGHGETSAHGDQFGLAVSLYEALMGVPPFAAEDPVEYAEALRRGTLHVPTHPPALPRWLLRALRRALGFSPADRHPSMAAFVTALRRGLARRRRWWLGSLLATSAVVLPTLGWAWREPPCASLEVELASAQARTDATRERLEASAAPPSTPYLDNALRAFDGAVDRHLQQWTRTRLDLCESQARHAASGAVFEAALDRQLACLEQTRTRLDALLATLAEADASELASHLVQAQTAIERLPSCDDPSTLARWPLHTSPSVDERLAYALRLELGDNYPAAEAEARAAVQESAELPFAHAEAQYRLGHVLAEQERGWEAFGAIERARNTAFEAGHDTLLCEAVAFQAKLAAAVELDPIASARELALARACMQRTGLRSPFVRAELLEAQGLLAQAAGDADAAVEAHEQALAERIEHLGPKHFEVAKSLHNLGNALVQKGELTRAITTLREALDVYEQLLGASHPSVAKTQYDLADALLEAGELDDAARGFQRALSIYEQLPGPSPTALAGVHVSLARVALLRPQPDLGSARTHLDRARALQHDDPNLGPNHPDRATLLQLEGALVVLSTAPTVDYRRALAAYAEATAILRRHDPDSPLVLDATLKEAEALYGLGDHDQLAARVAAEGSPLATYLATLAPSKRGALAWWIGLSSMEAARTEQAQRYLQIALDTYQELGDQDAVDELSKRIKGSTP